MPARYKLRGLKSAYASELRGYLASPGEAALQRAYELGRRAIVDGLGVLDLAASHRDAIFESKITANQYHQAIDRAFEFFAESLSPFEMTHRSFREASIALGRLTRELEDRVSERTHALRLAEEKYRGIFENATEGIYVSNQGKYVNVNPAFARILAYESPEELIDHVARIGPKLYVEPNRYKDLVRIVRNKGSLLGFESRVFQKDGKTIWISENVSAIRGTDDTFWLEGVVEEITKRKESEEKLTRQALYDSLTELPNRALFLDRLEQAVQRAMRRGGYSFAVLFLDLDRFKSINDTLGHAAGDDLLRQVAQRLLGCLRPQDTVGRMGGDEFTVLLDGTGERNEALRVVERIQRGLSLPFRLGDELVSISASIGWTLSKKGYDRTEDILKDADEAMYRARAAKRTRHKLPGSIGGAKAASRR